MNTFNRLLRQFDHLTDSKYFDFLICLLLIASSGVFSFCFLRAAYQVHYRQPLNISIQEPVIEF